MISSFPSPPITNVGGVAGFRFTPIQFISQLPAVSGKIITAAVTFFAGFGFLDGYATLETLKFTEIPKMDANGVYYQWTISGFTPGDTGELVDLMEYMSLVRHLVLITDMTGINRLVGYNAPLDFTADFSPGDDTKSSRGYSFKFTANSPRRAPVYIV